MTITDHIAQALAPFKPDSVLILYADHTADTAHALQKQLPSTITLMPMRDAESLSRETHYDVVTVLDALTAMKKSDALHTLALCRDVISHKMLIFTTKQEAGWDLSQFLSLGFHEVSSGDKFHIFGFDLANYKTTPDWLNAKHWANPDMWDKTWW